MVDLSALIRRESQLDDHPPAPPASTPPVPLRRPPPARPREPRLAPAARRVQANGDPAQAAHGLIASSGSGWPGSGPAGGRPSSSCRPTPSCGGSGAASASTGPGSPAGPPGAARPSTPRSRALVRRMAAANPLWGAPRIHGELLKLGIDVAERTVSRLIPKRRTPPSQTWRTFLDQPRPGPGLHRFLHGAHRWLARPLRPRRARPPSPARRPLQRHRASHRGLDRPADRGRLPGRLRAVLPPPRSRRFAHAAPGICSSKPTSALNSELTSPSGDRLRKHQKVGSIQRRLNQTQGIELDGRVRAVRAGVDPACPRSDHRRVTSRPRVPDALAFG